MDGWMDIPYYIITVMLYWMPTVKYLLYIFDTLRSNAIVLLLLLLLFMMMLLQLQSRTHIFFFALWEYHMRTHRHQWQPSSYDRYICYASIVQLQMRNLDKYIAVDELMNASFYHTIVQSPKLIDSIENWTFAVRYEFVWINF